MIEDIEMQELFKIESEEHLQLINEGLLHLEKFPEDEKALETVFREAHSLKGSSRMLGLVDIEMLAHRFEDILAQAKKGDITLTSKIIDTMYACLDVVRTLVTEALTGIPSGIDLQEVLSRLNVDDLPSETAPIPEESLIFEVLPSVVPESPSTPVPTTAPSMPGHPPMQACPDDFRIETIRVETKKLDMLMTLAGELTVANNRISQHQADLADLGDNWAQYCHDIAKLGRRNPSQAAEGAHLSARFEKLKSVSADDTARLSAVVGELRDAIRSIRLIPLATIFNLFPRMVRDLSRDSGKEIELLVQGAETVADKRIVEEMKDPLMHLVRNAIHHGLEPSKERVQLGKPQIGTVTLTALQSGSTVVIEVADDGRGLDIEKVRLAAKKMNIYREDELLAMSRERLQLLIFHSGLSTSTFVSDVSGRGVGLDAVRENVERLKGTVKVDSVPGKGSTFRINLPVTLATTQVLLVQVGSLKYALPVQNVLQSYRARRDEIFAMDGRSTLLFEGEPLAVAALADLLHYARTDLLDEHRAIPSEGTRGEHNSLSCVIIFSGDERLGLFVDELLNEEEIIQKPQSDLLLHVNSLSGATILGSGEVCLVLNPRELIQSLGNANAAARPATAMEPEKKKLILMAEDSLTTRTQMKRILEGAGYEVVTAVDGMDALAKISTRPFDALVSDITMPNMDGLALTAKIRQEKRYKDLPVILVTMLSSDEDKRKGLEAGANAYISKPAFDQKMLLDTLRRLL